MIPDGTYTAVVDRVEDGLATLELSDGEHRYGLDVPETTLPADAQRADAVLHVTVEDGDLVDAAFDPDVTEERATEAQDRFDRLSSRPPREEDGDEEEEGPDPAA